MPDVTRTRRDLFGRLRLRVVRCAAVVVCAAVGIVLMPAGVGAHSDFSGAEPADGSTVGLPLGEIVLTFALEVADPGGGVAAIGPDGMVIPAALTSDDGRVWRARFDPALAGGEHSVRYAMRAADGHMVEDAVTVTITAPATTVAADADVEVTTPTNASDESGSAADVTSANATAPMAAVFGLPGWVDPVDHGARLLGDLASLLLVGGIVFAWGPWARPGHLPGVRSVLGGSLVIAAAAIVEVRTIAERLSVGWVSALGDSLARSTLLSLAGAAAMVIAAVAVITEQVTAAPMLVRRVVMVPLLVITASPAFDGHAVTLGPRWAHAGADVVHMAATSIWIGAVVGLVVVMLRDRDALGRVAVRAARMLVGTVAAVVVTGSVMTAMIIDSPTDLVDTDWGRRLLIKLAAVAAAGLIGLYHHRVAVPTLHAGGSTAVFRRTLLTEAALLVGVVVITSWLVVAMP
ncbi:MAG: CopD family protein [Actinomycetota bacterium]|nr:CopD family protein [Actinomycetota bacterium]MDA3007228.1 CopD family protein [Actinomycetota bacterium]MDA3034390.1 CopD family protein [Actinomycetota bacterium]